LFTSPHLVSFRERLQVDREWISESEVVRLVESFQSHLEEFPADHHPTFFEVVTVMALRYFAEQKCDLVIWETGLGGRLDATNIVTPIATVITNIAFDHQQWLGDTLAKIAAEKAGIIKPHVPILTTTEDPVALGVIENIARGQSAPFTHVRAGNTTHAVALPGTYQTINAALAVATVKCLRDQFPVSDEAICRGLETVHWPGRLQLVTRANGQRLLLDGAHNIAGAEALREVLVSDSFTAGAAVTLVLGILADKNCRAMCELLAPLATRILLVPVSSERTASPRELASFSLAANARAEINACDSLQDALAQSEDDPFVVIAGSLYLIGEAMESLGLSPIPSADEKALNNWQPVARKS
jgi:dihydrofolate synthase/folylpolyglutamate synthase